MIEAAQAAGDFRVLAERGRRVLRAHIAHDTDAGIATIAKALNRAIGWAIDKATERARP